MHIAIRRNPYIKNSNISTFANAIAIAIRLIRLYFIGSQPKLYTSVQEKELDDQNLYICFYITLYSKFLIQPNKKK